MAQTNATSQQQDLELKRIVAAQATERARAKNARLRLLKERHAAHLAERREDLDMDDSQSTTAEL